MSQVLFGANIFAGALLITLSLNTVTIVAGCFCLGAAGAMLISVLEKRHGG